MSAQVCANEHAGQICSNFDSWNSNDVQGEVLYTYALLALVFTLFFILTLLLWMVAMAKHSRLAVWFFFFTIVFLASMITFWVLSAQDIQNEPIHLVYALSQYVSKYVRTSPRLNVDEMFPEHKDFEAAYADIRKEVLALSTHGDTWPLVKNTFGGGYNSGIGEDVKLDPVSGQEIGWRLFMVSAGTEFSGRAKELLPTLSGLIEKHNSKIVSSALSMLPGQVGIPPHVGYAKSVIRYMLPITIPADIANCYICINGKPNFWKEGESFSFDDCFIHSVHNATDETRILVYFDVLRDIKDHPWVTWISQTLYKWGVQNSQVVKNEIRRTEYLVSEK